MVIQRRKIRSKADGSTVFRLGEVDWVEITESRLLSLIVGLLSGHHILSPLAPSPSALLATAACLFPAPVWT